MCFLLCLLVYVIICFCLFVLCCCVFALIGLSVVGHFVCVVAWLFDLIVAFAARLCILFCICYVFAVLVLGVWVD